MVADHPQHVLAVGREAGERSQNLGHLGRGGIGLPGHDGGDGGGDGAGLVGVVGQAHGHQERAQIGVAEPERAELVALPGDGVAGVLGHQHADLEHDGPEPDGVAEGLDIEDAGLRVVELHQVQGSQIAGSVIEEHIFRTRIRCIDASGGRAGVPVVDRGIELDARIGALPGRLSDQVPQVAGLDRLGDAAIGPPAQVPVPVVEHGLDELVGDPHRVVGVLAGDRGVGLAVEVGRVAGGDQCGNLLLLLGLPADELLDVRVVDIDHDHLGRPARGAAALDGASGAVEDLEEAHQAGRGASAGERLAFGPDLGEVRARARAVLEDARLAHHQVEDPTGVDQVVLDRLDEAGVRGGARVGVGGLLQLSGVGVDVGMTLGGPGDAIGPVQPGVEPLGRVGRGHLVEEHVGELVLERLGILGCSEVAVALAPVAPAAHQPPDDLAHAALGAEHRLPVLVEDRLALLVVLRDAGLAEVLRDDDIGRDL
ncbi:hypothetical protein HRbin26_01790 [bacterium HR26]|nr:hypothetical protein HRbin26_01790 [bacterium HR26]